jgi:acetyl-CoA carboxylase biotin carboxyl carrier protein
MGDLVSKVADLAAMLGEHQLTALKVREGDLTIEVRREAPAHHGNDAPQAARQKAEGAPIPSPMAGVFYSRPSPNEDAFVQPGDQVLAGQVVGLIEAMKVFNEIESPVSGILAATLVEDGSVVQQGDTLYILEA